MDKQCVLFPTEDSDCKNFEYKRAMRAQKQEDKRGKLLWLVKMPSMHTTCIDTLSKYEGGEYWCSCVTMRTGGNCVHIRRAKFLLRVRIEAGYTGMTEKKFLKEACLAGEVR